MGTFSHFSSFSRIFQWLLVTLLAIHKCLGVGQLNRKSQLAQIHFLCAVFLPPSPIPFGLTFLGALQPNYVLRNTFFLEKKNIINECESSVMGKNLRLSFSTCGRRSVFESWSLPSNSLYLPMNRIVLLGGLILILCVVVFLRGNLMLHTFEAKKVKYSLPPLCFSYMFIFKFSIIFVAEYNILLRE